MNSKSLYKQKMMLPPEHFPGVYMTIVGNKACELEILSELSLNQFMLDEYA
tara:strand:+ start:304 stop:456 length:153 start_codon:yes stop_codon:yes gene_type:complete